MAFSSLDTSGGPRDGNNVPMMVAGQAVLAASTTNIADGATVTLVDNVKTVGFAKISLTARSNRAVTIRVLQGPNATKNFKDDLVLDADATEGAGKGLIVSVGSSRVTVKAINPAGAATTTFDCEVIGIASS